jgi:glycerol-3-phosphate dehydrogenase
MSIAIIGIGAFGTALAFSLSQKNADIILLGAQPPADGRDLRTA